MMNNGLYNGSSFNEVNPLQSISAPRPMSPTAISPKAFSNQPAINGMFGTAIPNTFNRNVTPLAQMTSQGYMPPVDPTTGSMQGAVDQVMVTDGGPVPPPAGVMQAQNPYYDLSN